MRISTRGMTKASLFKFLWIGNLAGWFFFFLLCGIASLFGAETITFNQQPVTGAKGFRSRPRNVADFRCGLYVPSMGILFLRLLALFTIQAH